MQDALARAYRVLELNPPVDRQTVIQHFRLLTLKWHPDKFFNAREKLIAEEKLKEILNARAFLDAHFNSREHMENICLCSPLPKQTESDLSESKQAESEKAESEREQSQCEQTKSKPPPEPAPDNFWTRLCEALDLGPLTPGEAGWVEPFRRLYASICGKHPGETIGDFWDKPVNWTPEHKKRCLLFALFVLIALDKIVAAINQLNSS